MLAAVVSLAELEVRAGTHAGWEQWRAFLLPFAIDAAGLLILLDRYSPWGDRAFALGLLLGSGALSVWAPEPRWQGLGLVAALVASIWRAEVRWIARLHRRDRLAEAAAIVADLEQRLSLADAERATEVSRLSDAHAAEVSRLDDTHAAHVSDLERQISDLRRQVNDDSRRHDDDSDDTTGDNRDDSIPALSSKAERVAWLRARIDRGETLPKSAALADAWGVDVRTAQRCLDDAGRPHTVTAVAR